MRLTPPVGQARAPQPGFTLIETLIVIAILGIMLSLGLPSFVDFIRNQRVKSASFDLYSTLVQARSEAITRNTSVTVAHLAGGWEYGWTVTDSGGNVIRTQSGVSSMTITGPASLVYMSSGRLGAAVTPFQLTATGTGVITRCITIDLSGRPVSKAEACS